MFWNNALLDDAVAIAHRLTVRPYIRHFRIVRLALHDEAACHTVWEALLKSPNLRTVHVLGCTFPNTAACHDLFVHLAQCKSLREVHLGFSFKWNGTLQHGLRLVLPALTQLRVLDVSGNGGAPGLGAAVADWLLQQQAHQHQHHIQQQRRRVRLDALDLGMNHLGDAAVITVLRALTEAPPLPPGSPTPRLWTLDLSDNDLTARSLPFITAVLRTFQHSLRTLRLSFNAQLFQTAERQVSLDWIHALRQCRSLRELAVQDCGLDGGLASSIFASCEYFNDDEEDDEDTENAPGNQKINKGRTSALIQSLFGAAPPMTIPLRTLSIQRNPGIDQASWRYILCHRIPTLSTLRDLTVGGFFYEPAMLTALQQNVSLETIHLDSPALGEALHAILKRNRRLRQVESFLGTQVATSRGVLGAALQRVTAEGTVVGLSSRYLLVSRLLVEDEEDSYRYRARKRRRLFERQRRFKLYGDCSNSSSSSSK